MSRPNYGVGGQQFVVIAAGGGRMGPPSTAEHLAFALPFSEIPSLPWPRQTR